MKQSTVYNHSTIARPNSLSYTIAQKKRFMIYKSILFQNLEQNAIYGHPSHSDAIIKQIDQIPYNVHDKQQA